MLAYQIHLPSRKLCSHWKCVWVCVWVTRCVCLILFTFINVIIIWRLKPFAQPRSIFVLFPARNWISHGGTCSESTNLHVKKERMKKIRLFSLGADESETKKHDQEEKDTCLWRRPLTGEWMKSFYAKLINTVKQIYFGVGCVIHVSRKTNLYLCFRTCQKHKLKKASSFWITTKIWKETWRRERTNYASSQTFPPTKCEMSLFLRVEIVCRPISLWAGKQTQSKPLKSFVETWQSPQNTHSMNRTKWPHSTALHVQLPCSECSSVL